MSNQNDFRIERDTMGDITVPAWSLWGAQTQRALENFPISNLTANPVLIESLARIKRASATVNARLGAVSQDIADAIVMAATEVVEHKNDDQFPLDVFQTGSGTSTNMNVNEVIAHIASERLGRAVHPNDHVNCSQSSNDVFPTAIHMAASQRIQNQLIVSLNLLQKSLENKAAEFKDVVKAGRTHLMDATPITLGQEFSGYSTAIHNGISRIESTGVRLNELALGGTAVGTGINVPAGFAHDVIAILSSETGIEFKKEKNHFEAQGAKDAVVETSGALRVIAISIYKIANDLRWMASGPNCGLGEIHLMDLQPGSSIMPGKVNPVVPEALCQVVAQVIGNDSAIVFGASAGNFELNVMMPVIAHNLLESIDIMSNGSKVFAEKCINGVSANVQRCNEYALSSPSIGTALNKHIGYEEAAKVIKTSILQNKTIRQVVIESGLLNEEDADRILDVVAMTKGG